jgi:hypothetical protein
VLALHKDYATAEPFIPGRAYDLRIQKIGTHYRVYKRQSSNWKGNVGNSIIEEIAVTDRYKVHLGTTLFTHLYYIAPTTDFVCSLGPVQMWADEASKMFGGLDILTVDAIHTTEGKGMSRYHGHLSALAVNGTLC